MLIKMRNRWQLSTISRAAAILSNGDRRKIILVIVLQISFGFLDLLGVGLVGVIGALAIRGVQSQTPGDRVTAVLTFLHLENLTFQKQVAILGLIAVFLLIGKTIFTIIFSRRILFFLSRRSATITANIVAKLLSQSILTIQSRSLQETLYALTGGVNVLTVGILGNLVSLISDLSLLMLLATGLFLVDITMAVTTFLIFGTVAVSLYLLLQVRAKKLGVMLAEKSIVSNEKIFEVLNSYRESVVKNRRSFYAKEIGELRKNLAETSAELSFMPSVSKYVIEVTTVFGAIIVCGIQFTTNDASRAVAVLSIFLASSSRIAPAVLRIQQVAISIRGSLGSAIPTLELIESLSKESKQIENIDALDIVHHGFNSEIKISNVTFTYPGKMLPVIKNASFSIRPGSIVALVGPSGAGKTTLVDLILGVLRPDEGDVKISGQSPSAAIESWPGALAYVPQDVMISNGTIRNNVALGFPIEEATNDLVNDALRIGQLIEFAEQLPEGIDSYVGDKGTRISGGQRQRLGIARAMFTKPHLLVLDEATSSLDGETEASISSAIQNMRGLVTVVMIAHRLSSVRHADIVLYLEAGEILASGTFEEVRNTVPNFDKQAQLMGL
jgi:ABC-type multidrug transport system fused ATPase/permease subunit